MAKSSYSKRVLIKKFKFANDEDLIFFSDPDEIPDPKILDNFNLKKNMEFFYKNVSIINLIFLYL